MKCNKILLFLFILFIIRVDKIYSDYEAPLGLCPVHAAEWRGEVPACEILNDFAFMKNTYDLKLIRIHILWNKIGVGQDKDYSFYDWYLDKVKEYNFNILCVIGMSQTASILDMKDLTAADYGKFVYSVVNRYKDKVKHWEFWNEPRVRSPEDKKAYVAIVKKGYMEGKKADKNAIFHLGAVVSDLNTGKDHEALYKEFKKYPGKYFDIIDEHPYADPGKLYFQDSLKRFKRMVKIARDNEFEQPFWISEVGVKPIDMLFKNKNADKIKAINMIKLITLSLYEGAEKFYYWHLRYADKTIPGNCGLIDSAGIRETIGSKVFANLSELLNRKIFNTSITAKGNFSKNALTAIPFRYEDNNFVTFLWFNIEKDFNTHCNIRIHINKKVKNPPYIFNLYTGEREKVNYKLTKRGINIYNVPVSSKDVTVVTTLPFIRKNISSKLIFSKSPSFTYRGIFLEGNFSSLQLEKLGKYMKAHNLNSAIIKNSALIWKAKKILTKYNILVNKIPSNVKILELEERCYMYPLRVNCLDCNKINSKYIRKIEKLKKQHKKIYIVEPLFEEVDLPVLHVMREDYNWYKRNNVIGIGIKVTPFTSTNSINLYFHSVLSYNSQNIFEAILDSYCNRYMNAKKEMKLFYKSVEELMARFHNKRKIRENFNFNLQNKNSKNSIMAADKQRVNIIFSQIYNALKKIDSKPIKIFMEKIYKRYLVILKTDLFVFEKKIKYPFTQKGKERLKKAYKYLKEIQNIINTDKAVNSLFRQNISPLSHSINRLENKIKKLESVKPTIVDIVMRKNGLIEKLVLKEGIRTRLVVWIYKNGKWSSHNGVLLSSKVLENTLISKKELIKTRTLDGFFELTQIFVIKCNSVRFLYKIKALKNIPRGVEFILNCALPSWPFEGRKSFLFYNNGKEKYIKMPSPSFSVGELKNIHKIELRGEKKLNIIIEGKKGIMNIQPRLKSIQSQMGNRKVYDFSFLPETIPRKKNEIVNFEIDFTIK